MAKSNEKPVEPITIDGNSTTALATVEDAERRMLAEMQKRIQAPTGSGISIKDKQFKFPNGQILDAIEVVVVDFVSRNLYYEGRYDPKNPAPPTCFAIGRDLKSMVPSENAPDAQNDDCVSCPNNQFGSNGAGKACKNTRLLAVLEPGAPEGQIFTLSVPPKSLKAFDGYVNTLASMLKRAPFGVITRIGFHPEMDHEQLVFSHVGPNENIAGCLERIAEVEMILAVEPDTSRLAAQATKRVARR